MKKKNVIMVKFACVVLGLMFIYEYDLYKVSAQGACNTQQACTWNYPWGACYCGDSDCGGCYVPSGHSGCGTCHNPGTKG